MAINRKRNKNNGYEFFFCLKSSKDGGKAISAAAHAAYLNRRSGNGFEVLHQSCRLPQWTADSGYKFFKAADKYALKNSVMFREFEFSLPRKLTLEHNLELIRNFIHAAIGDKYYVMAVYKKERAVVCYIMFSDRVVDEYEPRPMQQFFARVNGKQPSLGGAARDKNFAKKSFVNKLRGLFVKTVNDALARYGVEQRLTVQELGDSYNSLKPSSDDVPTAEPANTVRASELHKVEDVRRILSKINREQEELKSRLLLLAEQEKSLQARLGELQRAERPLEDIEFTLMIDKLRQSSLLKPADEDEPDTAYTAQQIKRLMMFLASLMQSYAEKGDMTAKSVLARLPELKKAVNLQIIKDKYVAQKEQQEPARYAVMTISGGVLSDIKQYVEISRLNDDAAKQFSAEEAQTISADTLNDVRIIAEAFIGSREAQNLVVKLKGEDAVRFND